MRVSRFVAGGVGLVVIVVAILVGVHYFQANAEAAGNAQYVALGSSFGAGPGVTTRAPRSPIRCIRSAGNYAHILARKRHLELTDMTCIGATSKDVLEGGGHFQKQIVAVNANTRLVTVTVGGNDASYLGNLWAWSCAKDKSGTPRAWRLAGVCKVHPPSVVRAGFAKVPSLMTKIANVVHRRAPHARLIFVDYTTVLPPSGNCPAKVPLTLGQMDTGRAVAARLARITAQVATSSRADLVKASVITKGHDVCSPDPWVYGYHFSSSPLTYGPLAYHPRLAAMQAIANGIDNDLKAHPLAP